MDGFLDLSVHAVCRNVARGEGVSAGLQETDESTQRKIFTIQFNKEIIKRILRASLK